MAAEHRHPESADRDPPPPTSGEIPADPVIDAFKAHVDRTLLRENLALTVAERMERFFAFLRSLEGIRGAAIPRGDR